MRVLVTGGTGFVGSHAVAALLAAGHDVRLLARARERVERSLGPLGVADAVDVVLGDVVDEAAVERALDGCAAVVHAASLFSLDVRLADRLSDVNVGGTERVLGTACRLGLDPVVHVSSVVALIPVSSAEVLTADAPVRGGTGVYGRSKAGAERVARRLQGEGHPLAVVYPTMILGPHDPSLGEGMTSVANLVRGRVPALPPGGVQIVDVRDVAAVLAALVEPGRGPRRYLAAGHHLSCRELVDRLDELTGRSIPCVTIPVGLARLAGRLADVVQGLTPLQTALTYESVSTLTLDPRCDDRPTWRDLRLTPRPVDVTLVDTIRWMVDAGLVPPRRAGQLAAGAVSP